MGRLIFLLSGEHPTLPASEVLATIKAEGFNFELREELERVLVLRTDADPVILSKRLAMSHWIGEHFCTSSLDEILDAVGSMIDVIPYGESIGVRVKRIGRTSKHVDVERLAKKIADQILEEIHYEVDLTNPDIEMVGILSEEKCVVGWTKARVDRGLFEKRRPPKRVAVHPGTLQPTYARALVNLARTSRDGNFLDPFCGVGGILIEAGLIGAFPIGVDIKPELVEGAEANLKSVGVGEFELHVCDARELEMEEVDAIATDPPYGHQTSTGGSDFVSLYSDAFPVLSGVLKPGGYLCISAPITLDLESLDKEADLRLVEKHVQRIHKNLTRNIYVFRGK